jgi:beta-barrel assembly-enhancing protease
MRLLNLRRLAALTACVALTMAGACVAPTSQLGTVSPAQLRAEQIKQQQFALKSTFADQDRLENLALPLLRAALPLCQDQRGPLVGIRYANLQSFNKEFREAAQGLGFSDTLMVTGVMRGSAAERAGLRPGHRIVEIAGEPAPAGNNASLLLGKRLADRQAKATKKSGTPAFLTLSLQTRPGTSPWEDVTSPIPAAADASAVPPAQASSTPVELSAAGTVLLQNSAGVSFEIAPDTACAFGVVAQKSDILNAYADGKNVYVTSAMMRFANDEELSVVLAHEIAHNTEHHIDAMKKNATAGAIFGAILDIAAATQGVNTGGDFTKLGGDLGAATFSQDFEREADYVGMYVLARAGKPTTSAAQFWRRMATESPGSIKFAGSHPTTAERFIRLEQAAAEISQKQGASQDLMPERKEKPKDP